MQRVRAILPQVNTYPCADSVSFYMVLRVWQVALQLIKQAATANPSKLMQPLPKTTARLPLISKCHRYTSREQRTLDLPSFYNKSRSK